MSDEWWVTPTQDAVTMRAKRYAQGGRSLSQQLMSSLAASPASPIPSPASAEAPTMPDTSGLSTGDLLASFDPVGSSLRTSLASCIRRMTRCAAIWSVRATTSRRSYWVLTTWGHRTGGNGSGSWPTHTTQSDNAMHTTTTGVMHPGTTLIDAVRKTEDDWRTPSSLDWKGASAQSWRDRTDGDRTATLPDQLAGLPAPASNSTSGNRPASSPVVLNPAWVSCLMGFPEDWCDIGDVPLPRSATPSSRQRPT